MSRKEEQRVQELTRELETVRNSILYHQERLLLTPADCQNQEVWEDVEMQAIREAKGRENKIIAELHRLNGQFELFAEAI